MDGSTSVLPPANVVDSQNETNTRLYGSRLLIARILWGIVIAFALGLFVVSLFIYPRFFALAAVPCTGDACLPFQLSHATFRELHNLGISPIAYLIFCLILFSLIPALVWSTIGVVLVRRKSDDWYVLLVSLWFIIMGVGFGTDFGGVPAVLSQFQIPGAIYGVLYRLVIFPVILLFPNGRLAPRWSIGLAVIWTIAQFPIPFADPLQLITIVGLGVVIVYRYLRVLTPIQRQQTKWLAFGLIINIIFFWIGWRLLVLAFPALASQGALSDSLNSILWAITFLLIPVAIGIAMARYRLWDIDILINRTLVYGTLTALLVGLYVSLILALQALLRAVTGSISQSPLIIVGSTLVIAALFQPLRRRLQNIIDLRFYRRKYDARRTIANFSASLRGEVDLTELSEQLVAVVEETMQPAHVSLWLSQPRKATNYIEKLPDSPVS